MVKKNQKHKRILVVAERDDKKIANITFELLRAGRGLADEANGIVGVAILGHEIGDISDELAYYSDEVWACDHAALAAFQIDVYADTLRQLCEERSPAIVLMGHTLDNLDLAPRVAARMKTELVTDCVGFAIEAQTGQLLCTKPVYGDNALATFIVDKHPQMATLRPRVMEAMERSDKQGAVVGFDLAIDESLARTELIEIVPGERVSLDKADAIVAGGRGVKEIERLKQLEECIELLQRFFRHVELGASRPLVDAGWLPSSHQLGLTGDKASPQLYIAVGISGASQHLSGIVGSKKIVAINKDEQAPIFDVADYGVVGKCEDVLPAFIQKLRSLS